MQRDHLFGTQLKVMEVNDGSGVVDEVTRHMSTAGRGAETEKIVMRTSMEERSMVRPGFDKQRRRKGRQRLTSERRQQGQRQGQRIMEGMRGGYQGNCHLGVMSEVPVRRTSI